jgi:high affinity sulfate transporter 1
VIPGWIRHYRAAWLRPDVIAGVVIWSVVVPQAVAYAQIAGLPPQAGLMAAPGALIGYALLGTSRTLVVSATTATAAVSAAAVGPLAHGDAKTFAALSATLALVAAVVFVLGGVLRLGALADLISKPVMTGFLFGLGLTIAVGQAPKLLGVPSSSGTFVDQLAHLVGNLGDVQGGTVAVAVASVALLVGCRALWPALPATLLVLVLSIVVSAAFDLSAHGIDVVGHIPSAAPEFAIPHVDASDLPQLVGAAFGVMLLSTEGIGVARTLATQGGYTIDVNRDLVAFGASNFLAGLSQGFVQLGGSSQTAAAARAGGRSQLASVVAAVLVVLTGLFLAGLFENLPQATLGAIVVVAVASFVRVDELERFARLRTSALILSLIALVGVLVLGVLPGLIVATALSLVFVIQRFSRPSVGVLARDPVSGAWGRIDRHQDWETLPGVMVVRADGPLFYANAVYARERILVMVRAADPPPEVVVIDLDANTELDVETVDDFGDLVTTLRADGIELRFGGVHARSAELLRRSGLADRVRAEPTIDAAVDRPSFTPTG